MIVMKFGGSSIKDAEMFKKVASIIESRIDKKPVIVLSAVKGVTDNLIKILESKEIYDEILKTHKKIISELGLKQDILDKELEELKQALESNKEKNTKTLDYIIFFGERMSTKILAEYLNKTGINAKQFISGDIGLITDSNFGNTEILKDSFNKIKQNINELDIIPIITGFGGKDKDENYTTFNRGGSDYVASLIGAAIDAQEIQIWTDVNGIMSSDPRVIEDVKTIPEISFDEASELAYFGAKVLHPRTILPAIKKNIPVLVLNTFEPENFGTRIVNKSKETEGIVKAISFKKGISIIDVKSSRMIDAHGYLAKIFEIFEKYKKPVDMISTSEINVSMSVDSGENINKIVKELEGIARIKVHDSKSIVYVVGASIKHKIGIVGKIFDLLAKNKIDVNMVSQCFDQISVGFVVDEKDTENAVKLLHKELVCNS